MIVYTHVVKGGGSSIVEALTGNFAPHQWLRDDTNMVHDPLSEFNLRFDSYKRRYDDTEKREHLRQYELVFGHFNAYPYFNFPNAVFVTMLRDPLERLISNYCFWKGIGPMSFSDRTQFGQGFIQNQMLQDELSILDFARYDLMRKIYSAGHFKEIDMARFDFVGDFTSFPQEIRRLSNLLGLPLETGHRNRNPYDLYHEENLRIRDNPALMAKLTDLIQDDIAFYEKHAGT